jgi:hypothetical protein
MNNPNSTQSKLVLYLVILLGFAGGFLYSSKIGTAEADIAPLPQQNKDDWKPLKDLKVDFQLLQRPEYKNLRIFGELPVSPGTRGKDDPFQ